MCISSRFPGQADAELLVQHGREAWEEMRTILDRKVNADIDKGFKI